MKFESRTFSRRFPAVECAIFVVHEPELCLVFRPDEPPKMVSSAVPEYRGTAAALILPDGRYWIGVTLCSPQDQFVKASGRAKAVGRAFVEYRRTMTDEAKGITQWPLRMDLLTPEYPSKMVATLRAAIDAFKKEKQAGREV